MATQTITSKLVAGPVGTYIADIADAVRLALASKARGPFIGIACGEKTVLVKRELFKKSLAGLRIVDAELIHSTESKIIGIYRPWKGGDRRYNDKTHMYETSPIVLGEPSDYRATWALKVYAAGAGVRATRLFLHQDPREYGNRKLLMDWQQAELKKRTPTGAKPNKYQKQIAILEKRLYKLGRLQRPNNPVLVMDIGKPVNFGEQHPVHQNTRRDEYLWHLQRPVRRTIMALALRTGWRPLKMGPRPINAKADLNSAQLYKELAKIMVRAYESPNALDHINWSHSEECPVRPEIRYILADHALSFKKWGELSSSDRQHKHVNDLWEYIARLWEFCGLVSKPFRRGSWESEEAYTKGRWGRERYYEWQSQRDVRREIENQIAAIKVLESEAGK